MRSAILLLGVLGGCGGSLVLKGPVTESCTGSGLKGCDALVDGVLMYVDGKTAEGSAKVKAGAASNSPDKVRAYAKALRGAGSLPGGEKLGEVAALLDDTAGPAPAKEERPAAAGSGAAAHGPLPRASAEDVSALRTSTVIPATPGRSTPCEPFGRSLEAVGSPASCTRAFVGPLIVTDVVATGACPGEVFVIAGSLEAPQWFLVAPASGTLNVHGGKLLVPTDVPLTIGVRGGPALRRDLRCAVTWAGYRPGG